MQITAMPLGYSLPETGQVDIIHKLFSDFIKLFDGTKKYLIVFSDMDNYAAEFKKKDIIIHDKSLQSNIKFFISISKDYQGFFYLNYRGHGFEHDVRDEHFDFIFMCMHPQNYTHTMLNITKQLASNPVFVLPFATMGEKGKISSYKISLGNEEPIVISSYPLAGTARLGPIIRTILDNVPRYAKNIRPAEQNPRLIKKIIGDTPAGTYFGADNFNQQIIDDYYSAAFESMNYFEYANIHANTSTHIFTNFKTIYLRRDPRDIMISSYKRFIQSAPEESRSLLAGLSEEDALLKFASGFEYINPQMTYCYKLPSIDKLAKQFAEAGDNPNIYPLNFEDMRYQPVETFASIMDWLELNNISFSKVSKSMLPEIVKLGSFDHQTGGKLKDADEGKNETVYKDTSIRKGVKGQWKDNFTPKIKNSVKDIIGEELIKMGYEESFDW